MSHDQRERWRTLAERHRRQHGIKDRHEQFEATRKRIFEAFEGNPGASQEAIARLLGISRMTVYRHLRRFLEELDTMSGCAV